VGDANNNRNIVAKGMSAGEIEEAQSLTRELEKSGNFLKALDK